MARLALTNSGPSVSAAQYTRMRWPSGRGRCERQIWLSVVSMVSISDTAVTVRPASPTSPNWLALPANCVR